MKTALVLGAGGFIGSHMVKRLKSEGYFVRGVDLKYPEFSQSEADQFLLYDLRMNANVEAVFRLEFYGLNPLQFSYHKTAFSETEPFNEVYQFAADMGGAGYIFTGEHDADVMHNSAAININVAEHAVKNNVGTLFFSSSACVYPEEIQGESDNPGLKESDAYPANPDSDYGIEKLFSERLYLAMHRNYGLNIRIARFHNIFGPEGTYKGGKEKAPAAICRKVLEAKNHIEIWGDGTQTRSFLYIDECIEGVRRLVESDFPNPINIGSDELISINDLAKMVIGFYNKDLKIKNISGPTGVQGRNSDNMLIKMVLDWSPTQPLETGMEKLFNWIKHESRRNKDSQK